MPPHGRGPQPAYIFGFPDLRYSAAAFAMSRTPISSAASSPWKSGEWFEAAVRQSTAVGVTPSCGPTTT